VSNNFPEIILPYKPNKSKKNNSSWYNNNSGYMAPEYALRGIFSVKSDAYSFGVLTLEVVSGVKIRSTDQIMESESLIVYVSTSVF